MQRWSRIALGVAGLAAAGAAYFLYNERNVEKPAYRRVDADGPIELRDYPELLVAETLDDGARDAALDAGFGRLAGYIFAKSRGGEAIAMTAPVLSDGADGRWRTRFVMPAQYSRATLPPPGPGVTIEKVPARRVGAIRFNGRATEGALAAKEDQLREWLAERGLEPAGPAEYGFYNPPFTPPPMRRNEVLIPLRSAE
jgi:hypothetical protein